MDNSVCSVWIKIGAKGRKPLILAGIYREFRYLSQQDPNLSGTPQAQKDRWFQFVEMWRKSADRADVAVIGDINLDFLRWTQPDDANVSLVDRVKDVIETLGFYQQVTTFTRTWNHQPDSCLDHLWMNNPGRLLFVQNIPRSFSDHNLIYCAIKTRDRQEDIQEIKMRDRSSMDTENYKNRVADIDWDPLLNLNNLELANSMFEDNLNAVLDELAPLKFYQRRSKHRNWVSKELETQMKNRDSLRDKARMTGTPEDWKNYKTSRNECTKNLKICKDKFYNELFKKMEGEKTTRNLYSLTNQILQNKTGGSPQKLLKNGQLLKKPVELANLLMDFYNDKVSKIINDIQISGRNPLRHLQNAMQNWRHKDTLETFKFREITENETETLIKTLSDSTALGHDNIDSKSVKMAGNSLKKPLRHLINLSLMKGKFAQKWKLSIITPRIKNKKLNRLLPSSYRPVVLCTTTSKLVEKAAQQQLSKHFEHSKLFNPSNHAYRSKLNTTTTLMEICDNIHQGVEDKKLMSVMALDFTAAFDCVNHQLLLKKLEIYKVGPEARNWIKDYLSSRTQYVSIGRANSKMTAVLRGVPQGSVIGPILFAIFSNELTEAVKNPNCENRTHQNNENLFGQQCPDCGHLTVYADDSTFVIGNKIRNLNELALKRALNDLNSFIQDNQLSLNLAKTGISEQMIHQKKSKTPGNPPTLTVIGENGEDKEVKDSQYLRILGANVQSNLGWQKHLEGGDKALLPAVRSSLGQLRHQGDLIPRTCRNNLAKTLILSRLQYLMPLWGGAGHTYIQKVQTIMNVAARWVSGMGKRTRTSKLMDRVGWFSAKELIRISTALQTWKCIYFQKPEVPIQKFTIWP